MTNHSFNESTDPIRQDEIDWLVEGELSPAERGKLVARLDRHANGWRRCALAFMERDALRGSLGAIRYRSDNETELCFAATHTLAHGMERPSEPFQVGKSVWRVALVAFSATAATVLIAIGLGVGYWLRPETANSAAIPVDNRGNGADRAPFDTEQNPAVWLQVSNAVNRLNVADGEVIAVVGVPREHAQIEFLPIIQSETLRQQILELPKPDLPRGYQEQAERAGWKFDVSRQLLSLSFPDGGNQLLPLDTVRYRYVGFETF